MWVLCCWEEEDEWCAASNDFVSGCCDDLPTGSDDDVEGIWGGAGRDETRTCCSLSITNELSPMMIIGCLLLTTRC